MATILFVTEEPARYLASLREIVGGSGGVSAWNGKLLARITAETGVALRHTLIPALGVLRDGASLPKLWRI
jgi:urease accessory protein